jgi:hypothetical protein
MPAFKKEGITLRIHRKRRGFCMADLLNLGLYWRRFIAACEGLPLNEKPIPSFLFRPYIAQKRENVSHGE